MSELDLSDAFGSEFLDLVTVQRRREIINKYGESSTAIVHSEQYAVVCPAGPDDLVRLGDLQFANKAISVVTQFALRGETTDYQPDIVIWHGSSFIVKLMDDCSNYGQGFIEAICVSIDTTDRAPHTSPAFGFGNVDGSVSGFGYGNWAQGVPSTPDIASGFGDGVWTP